MTKEDIIFALIKEQPLPPRKVFTERLKQKYPYLNVEDIYLRVVNYQNIKYDDAIYPPQYAHDTTRRRQRRWTPHTTSYYLILPQIKHLKSIFKLSLKNKHSDDA